MRLTTCSSTSGTAQRSSLSVGSSRSTQATEPPSPTASEPTGAPSTRRHGRRRLIAALLVVATGVAVAFIVGAPDALAAPSEVAASGAVRFVALAGSVDDVLNNIRTWIMGILALLATVFLTIGGVRYVIAAGDPGEVAKAKIAFKSAAIGYALAALAPLVVTVLKGIVGA